MQFSRIDTGHLDNASRAKAALYFTHQGRLGLGLV